MTSKSEQGGNQVPKNDSSTDQIKEFQALLQVCQKLRDPEGGCPWDLKQTHQSLKKYLVEECYEYLEAIDKNDHAHMSEELGDILLQVLLHGIIAEQENRFSLKDVFKKLREKLITRHPHVFGSDEQRGVQHDETSALKSWHAQKDKEEKRTIKGQIKESVLHIPSLLSTMKIGLKAEHAKFDWDDKDQVVYKVEEEWQELKEELAPQKAISIERVEEEMGDMFFSIAQLARHLNIDPEQALKKGNEKFIKRFNIMLEIAHKENLCFEDLNSDEKERLWQRAKLKAY